MLEKDFETKFKKVADSFTRRASVHYKKVARTLILARIEAAKKKAAEARAKIIEIRKRKLAALEKIKALRLKNAWVKKANEDDDASSKEAAAAAKKKAWLLKVRERWAAAKKRWEERKLRLKGIRDRLRVIRLRIAANRKRRLYWRMRTIRYRRRLVFIRKRRAIIWARLRRFRLWRLRAIAARKKAKENEENTTQE